MNAIALLAVLNLRPSSLGLSLTNANSGSRSLELRVTAPCCQTGIILSPDEVAALRGLPRFSFAALQQEPFHPSLPTPAIPSSFPTESFVKDQLVHRSHTAACEWFGKDPHRLVLFEDDMDVESSMLVRFLCAATTVTNGTSTRIALPRGVTAAEMASQAIGIYKNIFSCGEEASWKLAGSSLPSHSLGVLTADLLTLIRNETPEVIEGTLCTEELVSLLLSHILALQGFDVVTTQSAVPVRSLSCQYCGSEIYCLMRGKPSINQGASATLTSTTSVVSCSFSKGALHHDHCPWHRLFLSRLATSMVSSSNSPTLEFVLSDSFSSEDTLPSSVTLQVPFAELAQLISAWRHRLMLGDDVFTSDEVLCDRLSSLQPGDVVDQKGDGAHCSAESFLGGLASSEGRAVVADGCKASILRGIDRIGDILWDSFLTSDIKASSAGTSQINACLQAMGDASYAGFTPQIKGTAQSEFYSSVLQLSSLLQPESRKHIRNDAAEHPKLEAPVNVQLFSMEMMTKRFRAETQQSLLHRAPAMPTPPLNKESQPKEINVLHAAHHIERPQPASMHVNPPRRGGRGGLKPANQGYQPPAASRHPPGQESILGSKPPSSGGILGVAPTFTPIRGAAPFAAGRGRGQGPPHFSPQNGNPQQRQRQQQPQRGGKPTDGGRNFRGKAARGSGHFRRGG